MHSIALGRGSRWIGRLVSPFLLLVLACGGDHPAADAKATPAAGAGAPAGATFAPSLGVDLTAMTKTPSGLYYRDLVAGDGKVVAADQFVAAKYTGWLTNGTQFDATGPNGSPYVFKIGTGQVIKGWDEGLLGMRVGGIRLLVVPPELGYGAAGSGDVIPPNAILVFRVEMVSAD